MFCLSYLLFLPLRLLLLSTLLPVDPVCFLTLLVFLHFRGPGPIPQKGCSLFLTLCFPAFCWALTKSGHYFQRLRRGIRSRLVAVCLLLFGQSTIKIVVSEDKSGSKVKRENGDVAFWLKILFTPPCFAICLRFFGPENRRTGK